MADLKAELLSYISDDKKNIVEPLVDRVIGFYGNNIELNLTSDRSSRFTRNLKQLDDGSLVPYGQIFLSNIIYTEEALVHELLHLSLPIQHSLYTIGFDVNDTALNELFALIHNVLEHDMFIQDFLKMGYSKNKFLALPNLIVDYKQRIKQGGVDHVYWMNEYLRLMINLNHISDSKVEECRKGMAKMRDFALSQYPTLNENFKAIRQWAISKKFHLDNEHVLEVKDLFAIMGLPLPTRYLRRSDDFTLKQIQIL